MKDEKKTAPKHQNQTSKRTKREARPTVVFESLPEGYTIEDSYAVGDFAKVVVAYPPNSPQQAKYYVVETTLGEKEKKVFNHLLEILVAEIEPPEIGGEENARKAIRSQAEKLLKKYAAKFHRVTPEAKERMLYYLERDMLGFGVLNVVMEDHRIEDISCDGVDTPIYVWHRNYESIPTNIMFTDREALDDYIIKLAHKSGKHVSSAFPVLDAMIMGKHRLAATFREEISPRGSTFTVRKFREEPFSILELIDSNTLTAGMAAYLWLLLENKIAIMILGPTGSGKTSLLNALSSFIRPGLKIVTAEETPELNLPSDNWVKFVTRESYGLSGSKIGEIDLFELVKMSLRYRPDFLIVGEIRGKEAYVLFQALATGHGGISTMHAENIDYAVKRLISPPMDIPESHVPLMNLALMVERVNLPNRDVPVAARRITSVWEVLDFGRYNKVCSWDPRTDTHVADFSESAVLAKIAAKRGFDTEELVYEVAQRTRVLRYLSRLQPMTVAEVSKYVAEYYENKQSFIAKMEEKQMTLPAAPLEHDSHNPDHVEASAQA